MHKSLGSFASIALALAGTMLAGSCWAAELIYVAAAQDLPGTSAVRHELTLAQHRGSTAQHALTVSADLRADSHGFIQASAKQDRQLQAAEDGQLNDLPG